MQSKLLAGLGLYCVAAGLPMAGLLVYVLIPGHIAAPFEWAMVLPLSNIFLVGLVFHGAGLLTGLRPARWFGSRGFGIGLAIASALALFTFADYWRAVLFIVLSGAIICLAVGGSFQTGGFYRHQPWWGKLALSLTCAASTLLLCGLGGAAVSILFSPSYSYPYSRYQVTKEGVVYLVTQGGSEKPAIVDLEGRPLLDKKTGKPIDLTEFNKLAPPTFSLVVNFREERGSENGFEAGYTSGKFYFTPWRVVDKTLWYITRNGQIVTYDSVTRRKLRTIKQETASGMEAAVQVQFHRSRFNPDSFQSDQPWYLASDQTLYRVDVENQTVTPFFSTTNAGGIGGFSERTEDHQVLLTTTNRVLLLAANGQTELAVPLQPYFPAYNRVTVCELANTNHFVVEFDPFVRINEQAGGNLPPQFEWATAPGDITRHQALAKISVPRFEDHVGDALTMVFPTSLHIIEEHNHAGLQSFNVWDRLSVIPVMICMVVGVFMGRRFHFTSAEQISWAVFHALLGIPGLLAFFSVQEWPAKEPCPQCGKKRMVDREHCEYCDAEFAPPESNGTEIFAPALVAEKVAG